MNRARDFDDRIADWIEDGPTHAPDRVLESVVRELPLTAQRRRSLASFRRLSVMSNQIRVAASIAAIATIAVLALAVWGGGRPSVGGAGPAAVTPSTPSASPASTATGCSIVLERTTLRVGEPLRVSLAGFPPNRTVELVLQRQSGTRLTFPVRTDPAGRAVDQGTTEPLDIGTNTLTATAGGCTASAQLTVTR